MAKKSKKQMKSRSKFRTVNKPEQLVAEQIQTSQKVVPQVIQQKGIRRPIQSIQEDQYRYIGPEIARIAIISGAFFVVLIIISLIIK
jgi:hypothetical protein